MIADCIGCIYATTQAGVGQLLTSLERRIEVNYFRASFLHSDQNS
jgi:hypothetical protein